MKFFVLILLNVIFICINIKMAQSATVHHVNVNMQEQKLSKRLTTKYNESYAQAMMALSAGAYVRKPMACANRWMPEPESWQQYSSFNQSCDHVDNTCLTYTIVSEKLHQMVIVFRGTKTSQQLFTEGWQSLQPAVDFHGHGKVNKYFLSALEILWPSVEKALNDSRHNNFTVTFTGHSLGGALASLASIKAVYEGLRSSEQIKLYTFGQPRVGCSKFAAKHDELVPECFRVVFRSDVVPHLPPCSKNKEWAVLDTFTSKPCDPTAEGRAFHHGIEIWYPVSMKPGDYFIECTGIPRGEDFRCSDLLSFEPHKYDQYIWDHRHYFEHKLSAFAYLGCDPEKKHLEESLPAINDEEEAKAKKEQGLFADVANGLRIFAKIVGIF